MKTVYVCETCQKQFDKEKNIVKNNTDIKETIVLSSDMTAHKIGLGLRITANRLFINFSENEKNQLRAFLNEA